MQRTPEQSPAFADIKANVATLLGAKAKKADAHGEYNPLSKWNRLTAVDWGPPFKGSKNLPWLGIKRDPLVGTGLALSSDYFFYPRYGSVVAIPASNPKVWQNGVEGDLISLSRSEKSGGRTCDMAINPFNTNILATATDGGMVYLHNLDLLEERQKTLQAAAPLFAGSLDAAVAWNPIVSDCLATINKDSNVRVFNIQRSIHAMEHSAVNLNLIGGAAWTYDGQGLVYSGSKSITCVDVRVNKIRFSCKGIYQTRSPSIATTGTMRAQYVITAGFDYVPAEGGGKTRMKQVVKLWDERDMSKPTEVSPCYDLSGVLEFWAEPTTDIIFAASRGGNRLLAWDVSRGVLERPFKDDNSILINRQFNCFGVMPRRCVNTRNGEQFRMAVGDTHANDLGIVSLKQISRSIRGDVVEQSVPFQGNLYPACIGRVAPFSFNNFELGQTSSDWRGSLLSMQPEHSTSLAKDWKSAPCNVSPPGVRGTRSLGGHEMKEPEDIQQEVDDKQLVIDDLKKHLLKKQKRIHALERQLEHGHKENAAAIEQQILSEKTQLTNLENALELFEEMNAQLKKVIEDYKGQLDHTNELQLRIVQSEKRLREEVEALRKELRTASSKLRARDEFGEEGPDMILISRERYYQLREIEKVYDRAAGRMARHQMDGRTSAPPR